MFSFFSNIEDAAREATTLDFTLEELTGKCRDLTRANEIYELICNSSVR